MRNGIARGEGANTMRKSSQVKDAAAALYQRVKQK